MPACDASLSIVKMYSFPMTFVMVKAVTKLNWRTLKAEQEKPHAAVFSFSTSFNAADSSFYKQNKSQT